MKKVIRCKKCGKRVKYRSVGFVSEVIHICSETGFEVDPDDGCTFGEEGPTRTGVKEIDINLAGDAKTNGSGLYFYPDREI